MGKSIPEKAVKGKARCPLKEGLINSELSFSASFGLKLSFS